MVPSKDIIAHTRTLAPGYETLAGTRADVLTQLRRGVARGEFEQCSNVALAADQRTFYVTIRRYRPAPPAWRKHVLPAAVALALIAGLAWLMLTLAAAVATLAGMAVVSGVAALGAVLAFRRRGRGGETIVEVLTRVTVRR